MARRTVQGSTIQTMVLEREQLSCDLCKCSMHVRACRRRRIYRLCGPVLLVCKLVHCSNPACPNHGKTFGPEQELSLALPRWSIGWDVFCWLGQRRFARHWSVPQLRAELVDHYGITLSQDAIEDYLQRYQCMVAARQQDFELLKKEYASSRSVMLSIDGLQPEKGHETLYVVRELGRERIWFATPLFTRREPCWRSARISADARRCRDADPTRRPVRTATLPISSMCAGRPTPSARSRSRLRGDTAC